MRSFLLRALPACLFLLAVLATPLAATPFLYTVEPCPCTGDGFVQIELFYLGDNDAQVEVFKDDDFGDPDNLLMTFEGVDAGDVLTLNADETDHLPGDVFLLRTYLRLTLNGEVVTTDFYSSCPSAAFFQPLEEHLILGKTYGNFTIISHTDDAGTSCSIDDAEASLYWQVGGNIVGESNNQFGTLNSEDVLIVTSSTPRGIITEDGQFGLGTANPSSDATLEVVGGEHISGGSHITGAENDGTNAALRVQSGSQTLLLDGNEIDAMTGNLNLNNNSDQDVYLVRGGGNVGIGTNDPNARLHVDGDFRLQSPNNHTYRMHVGNNGDLNFVGDGDQLVMTLMDNEPRVGIGTSSPDTRLQVRGTFSLQSENNNTYRMQVENDGDLHFIGDGGLRAMTLTDESGRVGIGTSDPQSALAVNGTVTAREVVITIEGWSDFVFEDDYVLLPLAEVQRYIDTHGHLPDVPSEKEVLEEGVSLGEMDAILLQKIEELTLYVLELKKENDQLKERLEVLEKD